MYTAIKRVCAHACRGSLSRVTADAFGWDVNGEIEWHCAFWAGVGQVRCGRAVYWGANCLPSVDGGWCVECDRALELGVDCLLAGGLCMKRFNWVEYDEVLGLRCDLLVRGRWWQA